jgi:3,4-dihydroxy 2-butanone 4-phosphate synthase/GTP cyclohydrolase II
VAAHILRFLQVDQVRLLTNNPSKLEGLRQLGIDVVARDPLQVPPNAENAGYLAAKAHRMRHLLTLEADLLANPGRVASRPEHPYVTLSYAQSLDGAISLRRGQPTPLSGPQALAMTHQLRAEHDAILVGIGTVLADDPRLTVRLVSGPDPQPVVVDSQLRLPPTARLMQNPRPPWIATTAAADPGREAALVAAGARVLRLPGQPGQVDLPALLHHLHQLGIGSLMVEGGAAIINNFLAARLVDHLVVTVTPALLGGLPAVHNLGPAGTGLPRLQQPHYQQLGRDLIVSGDVVWEA